MNNGETRQTKKFDQTLDGGKNCPYARRPWSNLTCENVLVQFSFFCDVKTSNIESFRWIYPANVDSFRRISLQLHMGKAPLCLGITFTVNSCKSWAHQAMDSLFWMKKPFRLFSCQNVLLPNWAIVGVSATSAPLKFTKMLRFERAWDATSSRCPT